MTTRHPELGNNRATDFSIGDHGSICLLMPHTDAARGWIAEHLTDPEIQFWGTSVVVEPRYLEMIIDGIEADGLEVL